jgi:hypothetical protein
MNKGSSSSRKRTTSNNFRLPDDIDKALLKSLLDKTERKLPFKRVCDERPDIFGAKGSELRKRVQKRRTCYLLSHPTAFADLATKLLGVSSLVDFPDLFEPRTPPHNSQFDTPPVTAPSKLSSSAVAVATIKSPTPPFSSATARRLVFPQEGSAMSEDEGPLSDIQTYRLDFQKPWNSPCHGMITIRGLQWEDPVTRQVVDKLSIYKPIYDIHDYREGRYLARLSQNGNAIIITEPVVPEYLWNEPEAIQKLVDGVGNEVCHVTDKSYKITRTRFVENKEYRTFESRYLFPKDVTCNNEFFNNDANGAPPGSPYKLVTKMILQKRQLGIDGDNRPIFSFMPFIVWRMAIDGDDDRTSAKKREDPDSFLSDALSSLGINLGTNSMQP